MPETDSAQHPNIFRAILKKRWYDVGSQRVSSEAFKLRSTDTGLSVLKAVGCSQEVCLAGQRECFGEVVLETNRVKDLGLAVVDDEPNAADFSENHAEITQIPVNPATDEDRRRLEDFATDLAYLSTLHYDRHNSYA